jgi:ZIP family zinc transporter
MNEIMSTPVLTAFAITVGAALATLLGWLTVVRARNTNPRLLAFGLSFAGGAMVYVSLVEIFVKSQIAFGDAFGPKLGYSAATPAFFGGVALLVLLDKFIPNPHGALIPPAPGTSETPRGNTILLRTSLFTTLAITAHNFPEGMATFFATLDNPSVGAPLAAAIAIHNIPEGISIAIPVYYATGSRMQALFATLISALAEPLGALIGYIILAPYLSPAVYGCVFGGIAGAMVYLALDELLPAARRYAKGHETVYGIISGMAVLALSLVLFK